MVPTVGVAALAILVGPPGPCLTSIDTKLASDAPKYV